MGAGEIQFRCLHTTRHDQSNKQMSEQHFPDYKPVDLLGFVAELADALFRATGETVDALLGTFRDTFSRRYSPFPASFPVAFAPDSAP
jgi:hypothetical protein